MSEQREKDIASAQADLRELWLMLGLPPRTIERAMQMMKVGPKSLPEIATKSSIILTDNTDIKSLTPRRMSLDKRGRSAGQK